MVEATKQCALVRWFDKPLYDSLCKDLNDKPSFEDFITYPDVRQLRRNRWAIEDGERARLIAEWQIEPRSWRRQNTNIGSHFLRRDDPEAQLAAVYHLAASASPERVIPFFQRWFARADKVFDMAQCNALLEMLRLQESWRGKRVSRLWEDFRSYNTARLLFAGDYYKTGSYFERPQLLESFKSVFDRKLGERVWIFHLHATGGTGKTMFLRWLTTRRLVPNRILCAKVDFDDFRLEEVQSYPARLFGRMIAQFVQQPNGNALAPLLERLKREEGIPGWNPDVTKEIRRQLRGANIDTPVVVMLDTLEEATLSAGNWLEACIDALRTIHDDFPNLTLVLSGRYDIAKRCDVLHDGEFLGYDLPRFDDDEAHRYLEQRGVPGGPVRDAIVERTEEKDASTGKNNASTDQLTGRNPFKLAMFAELALNRKELTAEEVKRFPSVDIAYLVERIIRRIDSQPIRWMIRYGAIGRHLTFEFANAVLLPPLLQALRGKPFDDDPAKGLDGFEDPLDGKIDVWKADSEALANLERNGMKDLWDQLAGYAREKGWLTDVTVDGQSELHFHPEVINPTRMLLREQPVFAELQNRAAEFFEQKARAASRANTAVRHYQDAIFHRFQGEGVQAKPLWTGHLREAVDRFGPAAAVSVAAEILGREYSEAERIPYPKVSSAELLVSAHCEVAELLMQAAGLKFAEPVNRNEFNRHVEIAREIVGVHPDIRGAIPVYLDQIFEAWQSGSAENAGEFLRAAIPGAQNSRHKFVLEFQLAAILLRHPGPDTPTHFREALRLLSGAGPVGVTATDLYLALASYYMFLGAHAAVIEAMSSAGRSAGEDPRARARVIDHQAWYAVGVGDISTARKRITEMRKLPPGVLPVPTSPQVLEERLAIMECEPFTALRACEQGLAVATSANERARLLDQRAEARALLLEFRAASDDWDSAATSYDLATISSGPARCALLSATMTAREMQDYRRAETQIVSALSLRGSADIEIRTELRLLMAFVLCRTGRQDEARQNLSELIERQGIPPHIHARVLIFALLFRLREASNDFLEDVLETVGQIQPISRTAEALDWVRDADGRLDVSQDFVTRLIGQFARPGSELGSGVELMIRRADLYRVFGRREEAAKELDRASAGFATEFKDASEGPLLRAWHLNLARKRLGQTETGFGSLLERALSTELANFPIYGAFLCQAAEEVRHAGDAAAAKDMLDSYSPPAELPNIWQARRADLLVELATPGDRLRLQREATELYRALGQSAPPDRSALPESREMESFGTHRLAQATEGALPAEAITISRSDLVPHLSDAALSHELAIDFLCADWASFASELRSVLRSRHAEGAPIALAHDIAALPWELGGAGTRSRQVPELRPPPSMAGDRRRPGSVQLLMPSGGEDDVRIESSSGFSLAAVYSDLGVAPIATDVRDVEFFFRAFNWNNQPPEVLHVVAAVREGYAGVYLDFASTSHRVESLGGGSSDGGADPITASFLGKMLGSLPQPPFVVLDITHPRNDVEAVRMMLLRNIFAAELFEFGVARGVLACGLARPDERQDLTAKIAEALLSDCVRAPLSRLRAEPPRDLGHVLPRHAAALWTNDPKDRLFMP
ncbi:ATP-binding protein [Sinorhizobium terangae]|uniref:ATP-binding protein n=1 Tax=Sinorhizobium terangae TaxID=110322 RepID=UPI0024B089FB|nr:ATP-binding protein [Sinorhizobium terangae]WFU51893.1 ATP-binding protein [Sinorhizobium terangae]